MATKFDRDLINSAGAGLEYALEDPNNHEVMAGVRKIFNKFQEDMDSAVAEVQKDLESRNKLNEETLPLYNEIIRKVAGVKHMIRELGSDMAKLEGTPSETHIEKLGYADKFSAMRDKLSTILKIAKGEGNFDDTAKLNGEDMDLASRPKEYILSQLTAYKTLFDEAFAKKTDMDKTEINSVKEANDDMRVIAKELLDIASKASASEEIKEIKRESL